jgi:serine/threonine protein kinase/Tol biopolymer transport system component
VIGETISHYDVIELLDRGEAGPVYKARDRRDDSLVALELLPVPPDAASGDRLRREAQIASALGHPHICPVLEVGEVLGRGLFVARRLDGETLRSRLERCPLAPEQALGLASQIAAALGRAHEQGLVHRDLRPSNVLVTAEGHARVAGFGLSWARANGSAPGQLYQSPEQLRGTSADAVDARSDIWSLGVLLYEMTTGRLPFQNAQSILEREPESMEAIHPGLPSELDEVVARALSKEPSDRPARMDDLLVSLRGLLAGGGLLETDATLVQVPGLRSDRPAPEPGSLDREGGAAGPAAPPQRASLQGTTIAQYRILEPLGGGAMGTVYEAEDTRLRRRVALKFLPDELTRDPVAKARFLQEAQAASALDHPNICTVHEVGETEDGHLYLAMAAYDGETVKDRIARSPLSVNEALDLACQAAQGLAKAHREGIVHCDVKPANLMVTRDGMVKILDFGVAKLRGAAGINVVGSFLGTPAYMSPEQARGEEVDPRSDVFSLGVVLYEMLAGTRPFRSGEGVTSALRSLLEDKPAPLRSVRPEIPTELERVVARMLAKPPADRFPTGAEVAAELTDIQKSLAAEPAPVQATSRRTWFAAAAILGVVLVLAAVALLRRPEPAPVQPVFSRVTEEEGREMYPSLAPDGKSFVYAKADPSGQKDIFLQRIDDDDAGTEAEPLNLTADSESDDTQPTVSPDGRWIAFRSEREGGGIYIASVEGGPVRRIADVGYNPAWSPDGRELAVATEGIVDPAMRKDVSKILRIDVATGRSRTLVGDDGVQPSWSPHGWRIAYWGVPIGSARRILWTVPADGGTPSKVLDDGAQNWNPVWSPDGAWLYFGSDRSGSLNLWRLPIDEQSGEVQGDPQPVTTPSTASGFWSLSRDGNHILYAANESKSNVERFPFDPVGLQVTGGAEAVTRGSHSIRSCAVSPDGSRIAFHAALPAEELFVAGIDGSGLKQLTDDGFKNRQPVWSPDGRRLLFYSNRGGGYEAWIMNADGGVPEPVLPSGQEPVMAPLWSPDGRRVACTYGGKAAVIDLTLPLESRRAKPLPAAAGETFYPNSWSADGKGLAGNMARLDGSTAEGIGLHLLGSRTYLRWTSRGIDPEWLHDGRRLLYIEAGKILAFDTQTNEARDVLVPPPHSAYGLVTTSPDDRSLFTVRAVDEGDIWLLKLRNQRGDAPKQEEKR